MNQVDTVSFLSFLSPESEMTKRIQDHEWDNSSLGPVSEWSTSLRHAVALLLSSGQPMLLAWGDDYIQLYNDAFRPLLGHGGRHPDSLGQPAKDTWPEAWHEILPLWENVKTTGRYFNGENMRFMLKRNGYFEEAFFSLSIAPVRDDNFRIKGVLVTANETTETVRQDLRIKQELMRFQHQIFEYQKNLSVRDEFMSIASHDLKSPLTALKIQTQTQKQLILKQDPRGYDKDRIRQFSELVDEHVGRLNRMVDDILEIGRIRRGKISLNKEEVELGRLVRDSIESVRANFKGRNFPVVETKSLVKGIWDFDKIKQVVANILITTVRENESSPLHVKVESSSGMAKLTITDKGRVFDKDYLSKIFELYERVAPKNHSPDAHGLYLTRKIVELHGGKISVQSSVNEGTTFVVTLPL